ncbi:MAG: AbrB/MazE/SpoVT family DNA-binding domain-containing protein [Aestuariivita sp.]|nr:AbrB/MazE/SpoVT family DNA-binding domain-containing protein [Aestuariivita sp.]MCY4202734.1 AbrB/MazE/SpoVT family DNA-binding domain-containing protein [Aestuariivita sp.]MCY4289070.1 AbrB/MazE/SpoVT family DNA-binding domain-containing protein [Aestuariivita sp.]MCY4347898.1 AbrB/MazE/SpoVT family DNA-binding domain-containing protein [Aestuariivita sp.]
MTGIRVRIGTNGRLVVPIRLRKEIGLTDGKSVLLEIEKGELRIRPMKDVLLQAQQRLGKFLDDKSSLADDLIAERHAEASRE